MGNETKHEHSFHTKISQETSSSSHFQHVKAQNCKGLQASV